MQRVPFESVSRIPSAAGRYNQAHANPAFLEAFVAASNLADFPYEPIRETTSPAVCEECWRVAMGLQEVDGLRPYAYARKLAEEHVEDVCGI